MGERQGINVHGYAYPNVKCAKELVDNHFAVLKRWVDKCVKEIGEDVSFPTELVIELSYKGGLLNTIVDLVNTDRKRVGIKEIKAGQRKREFSILGRCTELRFYNGSAQKCYVCTIIQVEIHTDF